MVAANAGSPKPRRQAYRVNFYFFTMAALPFALMMNTIVNGIAACSGWASDHIGRELAMGIAFSLQAVRPVPRLGSAQSMGFRRSLRASCSSPGARSTACSGHRRRLLRHEARDTIYGLLYRAKGIAAFLVPFGALADGGDRDLDERALHDGGTGPERGAWRRC